jgi:pimeloyl-ACP methyl ester carboxylesterase
LRPPQWDTLPHSFQELGPSYRVVDPIGTATWAAEAELTPPVSRRQGTHTPVTAAGLASLTVPILLATGDADLYMPPAMMREMAKKIPKADLEIFTDSGHNGF